ncbi:Integrase [Streptococcus sp. DD10]|uniref:tyrosine-type recombinase/integrase n=1 Tax=Streptococcus sp. DD10 TaxID=1777878 RepID=UPI000799D30E|nr:site-specific integrase [Streptococcus sp. DD10]KXT74182.1 Integrase [Streptococcus sp. DD10]
MAISYRQRGKKKTWDYRIFDKNKVVVASNSGFKTKKEAILEATQIELELLHGNIIDSSVSLYDLWQTWYNLQIKPLNKSEGTLEHHLHRGKLMLEHFKDKPAIAIRASDYQEFINGYAQTVSKDTVRRLNAEVRKVVRFAKRDKLSITDFTDGVIITGQASRKTKSQKAITSTKDYHRLLSTLKNNMDRQHHAIDYLLYVQLKSGLRFGEVLGLTWDCVLYDTQEIHTYRRYDPRKQEWRPPKTDTSVRNIPIDIETLNLLAQFKELQAQELKDNDITNKDNFIFYSSFGEVPSNYAVNTHLRALLEQLKIAPYDLSATGIRHTYASIMLAYGIDIWVIAENMGHKDITQITKTYGHLIKEKAEKENNRIREFLSA